MSSNLPRDEQKQQQQQQVTKQDESQQQQKQELDKPRTFDKQIQAQPFIKTLFKGDYVYDYMKFPEFVRTRHLNAFTSTYVEPLTAFLDGEREQKRSLLRTATSDKRSEFTSDAMHRLRQLHVYGQSFPREFGGVELDQTSVTRLLEACSAHYPALAIHLIYNSEIAAKCLLLHGSSEQKAAHMPRLASGHERLGFCYAETTNSMDAKRFETTCRRAGADEFALNGTKAWVSLLATASAEQSSEQPLLSLLVAARSIDAGDEEGLSLFVIDSRTPGVKITEQTHTGTGLTLCAVELADVRVKASESLVGEAGKAFKMVAPIVENSRYMVGAVCVAILKNMLKETAEFCVESRRFDRNLSQFPLVQERIARVEASLYAMEAMTYLTAGIVDSYQQADVACESALVKIYCTEQLAACARVCSEIMAMRSLSTKHSADNAAHIHLLANMLNSNGLFLAKNNTNILVIIDKNRTKNQFDL